MHLWSEVSLHHTLNGMPCIVRGFQSLTTHHLQNFILKIKFQQKVKLLFVPIVENELLYVICYHDREPHLLYFLFSLLELMI